MSNPTTTEDLYRALTSHLAPSRIHAPGDRGWEQARTLWNGAVTTRPALVVRPHDADEVAVIVRAAREASLPISVRGGGHDWAGRALREGGLVVDLDAMRAVTVDGDRAVAGGGARVGDVVEPAARQGLSPAIGTTGAVGMAGFTLGGGYGPLSGQIGLGADNLIGAQVVLADGRVVDTDDDPDLLWALRGGGGNFGVVTALRVRLHPIATPVGGMTLFPWPQARAVLDGVAGILDDAPDALTVQSGVVAGPDGSPLVFVAPTWSGDTGQGSAVVDRVVALGDPVLAQVGPTTVPALLAGFGAFVVDGLHQDLHTRTVAALGEGVVDAVIAAGEQLPGPHAMISFHHFHGAPTRVAPDATAFGLRRDHLVAEIVAGHGPGDPTPHRAWAEGVWEALAPHSLAGGYPNLLGAGSEEQIAHAYGANAARLVDLKQRYDPERAFTATPLPRG